MGKTLAKIHACSAGNFGSNSIKIPQWVKANGGQYSTSVDGSVTHLITTVEAYKKGVEAGKAVLLTEWPGRDTDGIYLLILLVRVAKQLQTVKIVTYDWLSDSLLSKSRKPRSEKQYLLENIVKKEKKGKLQFKKGLAKQSKKPKRNGAGIVSFGYIYLHSIMNHLGS